MWHSNYYYRKLLFGYGEILQFLTIIQYRQRTTDEETNSQSPSNQM